MKPLGKRRCEILKGIRKTIAKANGIKYEPAECTHEGDCTGTCPKCDAEVKYLEQELCKKYGGMKTAASVVIGSTLAVGSIMSSCKTHKEPIPDGIVLPVPPTPPVELMGEPVVRTLPLESSDTLNAEQTEEKTNLAEESTKPTEEKSK